MEVERISFGYPPLKRGEKPVKVLREVSFSLEPGQIMVLLGPSGGGKSTLLQVVSGLLAPDEGIVSWDGLDLRRVPVHKRGFAMLFQGGELFPGRNVGRNIAYGLEVRRPRPSRRERELRVEKMLQLVHLEGYESRPISTLSGGQAGRVALARALAPQPRLILLDEPLAALDEQLKYELAADIREIFKVAGTTALYVTHDQAEAKIIADIVGVMCQGRLLGLGSWEEMHQDSSNPEVAHFLGVQNP